MSANNPATWQFWAFYGGTIGAGTYGTVSAFESGNNFAGAIGVVGVALGVYGLKSGLQSWAAQPSASGGAGGVFDNNVALAVAEGRLHKMRFTENGVTLWGPSDLAPADVLLTGDVGLAQYLKTTGKYGHGGP